jgi:hypothetical protein
MARKEDLAQNDLGILAIPEELEAKLKLVGGRFLGSSRYQYFFGTEIDDQRLENDRKGCSVEPFHNNSQQKKIAKFP